MNKPTYIGLDAMLIAARYFHFGSTIDLPHDWRQCDTAYYIWDFYHHGG